MKIIFCIFNIIKLKYIKTVNSLQIVSLKEIISPQNLEKAEKGNACTNVSLMIKCVTDNKIS